VTEMFVKLAVHSPLQRNKIGYRFSGLASHNISPSEDDPVVRQRKKYR